MTQKEPSKNIVTLTTNQFYKRISKIYDLGISIYFRKIETSPRQNILKQIPNTPINILEMCTGTATNSILIASQKPNAKIIGIDLSENMLHVAKEKITNQKLKNIDLQVGDATSTPFDNSTFDIVLISLALHEMTRDLAHKLLQEAYRVLKTTGTLIILEWETPKTFSKKALFTILKIIEPKSFRLFLKLDKQKYFLEEQFKTEHEIHCDYSCVYILKKT